MFLSPAQSPWTWYCDLETMHDYGLHMFENLQYAPKDYVYTEVQQKQLDALIQMTQRFGLAYMAGLLVGQDVAVSDGELAKQAAYCRQFAARYKTTPGLVYYLNGDFVLKLKDLPDIRRLWNAFLGKRYANDAALRSAWGAAAPEAALGEIPVKEYLATSWYDIRARDVAEFKSELMRRWIGALCAAIRSEDAEHPITAEYYQWPYDGVDLRLTVAGMDAANIGYFDTPKRDTARLMSTIKWNDMRRSGHGVNIGEFGVKTHDAWTPERGGYGYHLQRTDDERNQLFWWMTHCAMAMGVSKIQNWCWSDDPDREFPWGMAWNNPLRAKPALKLYRNMRLLSERIEPAYASADVVVVMPDTWRLGAPARFGYDVLSNAIECMLATNVPFDVVNESELANLLKTPPRLALMPCAYALSDDNVERLRKLAEAGSCVYLSGDFSIDGLGARKAERLERLAGAKFECVGEPVSGMPVPQVTPIDAKVLENPTHKPLYQRSLGKGMVVWSPEPWEVLPGRDLFVEAPNLTQDPATNVYLSLTPLAGVTAPLELRAEQGIWRATLTASGANRLVTVFPSSSTGERGTVHIKASGAELDLRSSVSVPAMTLIGPEGKPLLATGSGSLDVGGQRVLEGAGPWCVASLDAQALGDSRTLMANSTAQGSVWWRSSATELSAWMVEFLDGQLRVIAPAPLVRRNEGWELAAEPNELYVILPSGQRPTAETLALK
ncbi:MAG: hypothetical protein HZB26_09600 [Candidatus Hydrogenedentes bacterium]|nr:hypothetical protein [Candidatus Hydrogenedentota bacterium]